MFVAAAEPLEFFSQIFDLRFPRTAEVRSGWRVIGVVLRLGDEVF
jgi:hypothetical protein